MEPPAFRHSKVLEFFLLAAILVLGARLHWVESEVMQILPDDVLLMRRSQQIDAGAWRQIWAPQHVHFVPLYRLVRLPFDLDFPAWYVRFHAVVVAAHLGCTVALYLLASRYLRSRWAALATALLFAWSTVGDEAVVWKAASTFVFSWMFLLLGAWCLTRKRIIWSVAAFLSLILAVGFLSGALFVIPGVLLGAILLEPESRRRAFAICLGAWLMGSLAWFIFAWPQLDLAHYWAFGGPGAGLLMRLAWATEDTVHAYIYQLYVGVRLFPERFAVLALAALALALVCLRRRVNWRWIAAVLVMTVAPLFVILLIRREEGDWKISRYGYQSYTFWVVVFGSLLDAILWRLEQRPRWRRALLAVLPIPAGLYLAGHVYVAQHHRAFFRVQPTNTQAFWFGWEHFFRLASAHRTEMGRPLRLPFIEVSPGWQLQTIFALCHPRGLPGLIAEHGVLGTHQEQEEFWLEVTRARQLGVSLPFWRLSLDRHSQ